VLFFAKRLLSLIPVGLGVMMIVTLMIHLVPGDPVDAMLGDYATHEDKEAMRHALGLDLPVGQQVVRYTKSVMTGDFGASLIYKRQVSDLLMERIPATIELAFCALAVALLIAIPLCVISAVKAGSPLDFAAMSFAVSGVAIPTFWLGPLLILLFAVNLGWLPVSERSGWTSYILPALSMGTALAAALSRMTRNSMLDTLREDFVRTARAKGCTEFSVIMNHAFRNASLPLVTVIGLQFGVLLTGAIVTERIFDWPGLGSLLIEAINNRDYPLIKGCVLLFSFSYLLVNLLTDLTYSWVDPRIRPGA
jgi:peptide/nickel transport system permease protein